MTSSSPGASFSIPLLLFVVILVSQYTGCDGDGFQRFLVSPESLVAREGDNVIMRCVIANQRGKVQWTKDGFALGFHREVPGYPRYSYTGDTSRGQHHLAISSVALSDAGEYQCQVGPTLSNPPIWAAANLTVVLPPSSISLVGQSDGSVVEVVAGASLTLRCRVSDARPPPTVLWYLDQRQLPADQVDSQVVRSVMPHRWSVRSRLTLQPHTQDDGGRVICRVLHPGLEGGGALASSITLSVLHPPGPPTIRGLVKGDTLRAGERRNLTCTCLGGNPRPSLIWYRAGRLLDDSYTPVVQERSIRTVNALDFLATEADDGVALECQAASDLLHLPLTANRTLSVYYGPAAVRVSGPSRAEEGQSVALRCETSPSSPPASISWQVNGEEVHSPNTVVKQVPSGGWVTSSRLVWQVEGPWQGKAPPQLAVECTAKHQAVHHAPQHTLLISLVKPAGAPVLGGEVLQPVVAGSSAEVTCASPHSLPQTSIRIYHGGRIVPSRLEHSAAVTQARGRVKVNPPDNGSKIKCEVVSPASTKPKVTSTKLSVLFPPRELMGSLEPEVSEEGSRVFLTCLTSSSNPPANLTWTSEASLPPRATTTTSPAAFGGTGTRSEVVVVVQAEDHERRLTCEATNGLGSTLQKSFVLNVLHAPVWRVKPARQIDVWEGSDVSITASASANPGRVRYWWRRGGETLVGAGGTLHLGSATKSMSGNYSISAYSQRGAINTSFFLNVQYGPDSLRAPERVTVGEGDAVDVRCSASGNPLPALAWMAGNQTVASGVGVARLVLRSAHRKDTGLYTCRASDSLPSQPRPVPTKLIVTQPVSMPEKDNNKLKGSWASLGGKGQLVCQVRAAPAPSFLWTTQDGVKIYNSDKYLVHEPVVLDGLVTWSSVLEVSAVSPQDYQAYRCSATNTLGSGTTTLALRPPSRPFPPTNLTVISVSNVSVVLGWSPNLAGTRPSGYTVKYHPTGTRSYQYEEVSEGTSTGVEVGGLTPEVEYSLTAQAKNNQGRSDYVTPPITVTTLAAGGEGAAKEGQVTSFLLLVIIMSVFGLLVLNAAAIACFLHRRNKKRVLRGVHSTKATPATALGNSISNPDHHHHLHHHHNQVLLALNSLSRKKKKKSKSQSRQGSNRRANVIPLPSPSSQHHRITHLGRLGKQDAAADKGSTSVMHNGRIPRPPPTQQQSSKGTSRAAKGSSPENGKPPRPKKPVTRISGPPESHSLLVAHSPEAVTPPKPRQPQTEQDQLSESSHESTQTAIFCEDNLPALQVTAGQERHLQILENRITEENVHQLSEELKQHFENRKTRRQLQSDEGSSRSLDYIDLDHCTGVATNPKSVSGQHLTQTPNIDDTFTSSEWQPTLDSGPVPRLLLEVPAPYHHHHHRQQEEEEEEIQIVPSPPKRTSQLYHPPAAPHPNHWPPPTSPSHIHQHRIHSPTRVRMGHQPPAAPAKPRQHRVTCQRDAASQSPPPSTRHRRAPSQSPVRATYVPGPELPADIGQRAGASESPGKSGHHARPSESPAICSHHASLSESPVRDKTRRTSESPQRHHPGTLAKKSPTREISDSVSYKSLSRSRQQVTESPTKDVEHKRHSESPVRYREYHKAPPESPVSGHRYQVPATPLMRPQFSQVSSTVRRMLPTHSLPESPAGHQDQHPQAPVQPQVTAQPPATSPATRNSPLSQQKNLKPKPASKSSEADLISVDLDTGSQTVSFTTTQLNVLNRPLTPSSSGRCNLPPTPPRSKKPRPSPSQPILKQPSSRPQASPAPRQLSPEEISTSFALPDSPKGEDRQQVLSHQLPPTPAAPKPFSGGIHHESSRIKFREMVKAFDSSPSTVRRSDAQQGVIQIERLQNGQNPQSIRTAVTHFASANSPIATSSPLTHRRRTRFPDDFLWQSTSGKL